MQETRVQSPGQGDSLEEETALYSSILAWKISWVEETGGLQSMRSKESETTELLNTVITKPVLAVIKLH